MQSYNGHHPGNLNWESFCQFIRELRSPKDNGLPSFLNRVRLNWIENIAKGISVKAEERSAVQKFRFRHATKWGVPDGTAPLRNTGNTEEDPNVDQDSEAVEASAEIDRMREETEYISENRAQREQRLFISATSTNVENLFSNNTGIPFELLDPELARNFLNYNPINEPAAIFEELKDPSYDDSDNESDFDGSNDDPQPLNNPVNPTFINEPSMPSLNPKQLEIFNTCDTYFQALRTAQLSNQQSPLPLCLLVHGRPGCGKSFLTHKIYEKAKHYGMVIGCCAYTGKAATLMPQGRTIHNFIGLKRTKQNVLLYDWASRSNINSIGKTLKHFKRDKIAMVVIDEISMLTPNFLAIIDQKLRTLTGNYNDTFGNISIMLMGDFFQIPPINGMSLFSSVLNTNNMQHDSNPLIHGSWLFSLFKKIELTQQMRAPDDIDHMKILNQMRNYTLRQPSVTRDNLNYYKYLTETLQPLIPNREQQQTIYEENASLRDYFVAGALGYLKKNINPSLGLANGTSVIYHSLVLDEREDSEAVLAQIVDSTNANDIFLQYPPKYICVEIPNAKPEKFIGKTLVENKVVIPIPLK